MPTPNSLEESKPILTSATPPDPPRIIFVGPIPLNTDCTARANAISIRMTKAETARIYLQMAANQLYLRYQNWQGQITAIGLSDPCKATFDGMHDGIRDQWWTNYVGTFANEFQAASTAWQAINCEDGSYIQAIPAAEAAMTALESALNAARAITDYELSLLENWEQSCVPPWYNPVRLFPDNQLPIIGPPAPVSACEISRAAFYMQGNDFDTSYVSYILDLRKFYQDAVVAYSNKPNPTEADTTAWNAIILDMQNLWPASNFVGILDTFRSAIQGISCTDPDWYSKMNAAFAPLSSAIARLNGLKNMLAGLRTRLSNWGVSSGDAG